jgi:archaellum component FlaG (FlaF/FlaG flagellin family)
MGGCLGTPIASSLLVLFVVALKRDGAVLAHLSQSTVPIGPEK